MKIIVTGAAGFIGSHIAERLLIDGYEVVGIDNFNSYYDPALKKLNAADVQRKGGQIVNLDLAKADLGTVLQNSDHIFHCAAQPGISSRTSFDLYMRNNIVATQNLLKASQKVPTLRCFTYISTSSVYGKHARDNEDAAPKPTSWYGVTKLAAEQLALALYREQGFPACSMRLFSVCGPRERPEKLYTRLIECILSDEPFPLFEGSEKHSRSYTYVGDIVAGLMNTIEDPQRVTGQIFNIGSDVEITTAEGIEIIERILGKKAKFAIQPKRPGDQLHTHADITKARKILGYAPKTSLEDALQAQVDWYINRIYEQ